MIINDNKFKLDKKFFDQIYKLINNKKIHLIDKKTLKNFYLKCIS